MNIRPVSCLFKRFGSIQWMHSKPQLRSKTDSIPSTKTTTTTKTLSARRPTVLYRDPPLPKWAEDSHLQFRRADKGLYGGKKRIFGNNVPDSGQRTRRDWKPNVVRKKLSSQQLNETVRIKMTTNVLKTIRKCGGIDQYVTGSKPARIKVLGKLGWDLRM